MPFISLSKWLLLERTWVLNDDGTISKFYVNQDGYVLDLIIKKHTNYEEFIMYPEELKTKLPMVYVDL